jgi:hypothetical protein
MIVDHAGCLHQGITDFCSYKRKASPAEGLAHGIRFRCLARDFLQRLPVIVDWDAIDELPNKGIKCATFFLDFQEGFGIFDRGGNFQPVSNDSWVVQ